MNLCTNAFHAVQEEWGKIKVNLEAIEVISGSGIELQGLNFGTYVRLTVSDTGYGMDAKTKIQIFDPYFTTKAEGKGTGLGLSVTYSIVQKLNGAIKVYSESGQGNTFHVYLPRAVLSGNKATTPEVVITKGTERILLVDDEESIVNMAKQTLERYGYRVTAHMDSLAALVSFQQKPDAFDLVITDMTMPNMTGDILAGHIKALRQDIPIILCTGFSEKISKSNYPGAMIDKFLSKPISAITFNQAIRHLLDRPTKQKKDE